MPKASHNSFIVGGVKLGTLCPLSQSLTAWSLLPMIFPSSRCVSPARSRINLINSPDDKFTATPNYMSKGCNNSNLLVKWRRVERFCDRFISKTEDRSCLVIGVSGRNGRPQTNYKLATDITSMP